MDLYQNKQPFLNSYLEQGTFDAAHLTMIFSGNSSFPLQPMQAGLTFTVLGFSVLDPATNIRAKQPVSSDAFHAVSDAIKITVPE
jgi:hypothetical protein